jgi:hypothetical protein
LVSGLSDAARRPMSVRTADGTRPLGVPRECPCAANGLEQARLAICARQLGDDEGNTLGLSVDGHRRRRRHVAAQHIAQQRGRFCLAQSFDAYAAQDAHSLGVGA